MHALILTLALTLPSAPAQQSCYWDCGPGQPTFWERQEQRDTQERLRQIDLDRQVQQYQNWDRPRERSTSRDTITRCTAFWC